MRVQEGGGDRDAISLRLRLGLARQGPVAAAITTEALAIVGEGLPGEHIAPRFGVGQGKQPAKSWQGIIGHIGLSNITPAQLAEGQSITGIVCVQNFYNVAHRKDDGFIDDLAAQGIAYVPFFPLGGFTPLQSSVLDAAAASLKVTPMQLALAWLLQRSPNILLIPGTSSAAHLRQNLEASSLQIPADVLRALDSVAASER